MKLKAFLFHSLLILVAAPVGLGIGQTISNATVSDYNPPWEHLLVQSPPKGTVSIAHVDFRSSVKDPTGDVLYVATKNGEIYVNIVGQGAWSLIDTVASWENDAYVSKCAIIWSGPTDFSHMGDLPPVEKKVMDSAGVKFERPVSTIARCYVLSDDGGLEVWVHSGNAMDLIAHDSLKRGCAVLGGIIGLIVAVTIISFKKRTTGLL